MTTDNNEAMRLAGELVAPIGTQTSYQTAHEAAALLRQQSERIAELEEMQDESSDVEASLRDQVAAVTADLKSARAETTRIIALLDAANDERKALRAEVERQTKTDAEILACNYPDGEENGPTVAAPDFDLICFARQLGIRDTARKATQ